MGYRNKILYFSHVPWQWIKQRPQFMAEELSKYFDVYFFYEIGFNRKNLVNNEVRYNLRLRPLLRLPFNRFKFIRSINNFLVKFYIFLFNSISSYDIVYLTHPFLIKMIPKDILKNAKLVIYDCMDDALAFPSVESDNDIKKFIMECEKYLCDTSDLILTSSYDLKKKLIQRYSLKKEIIILNNAINVYDHLDSTKKSTNKYIEHIFSQNFVHITYIGTIDKWIDFETIKYAIHEMPNIRFHFYGPLEINKSIFDNKWIMYHGIIPHREVYEVIDRSDILILPFLINDLTRSVNPVKLYEYLYRGKPVIASYYEELNLFRDYIYFYSSKEDFVNVIKSIIRNNFLPPKTPEECKKFALENTWEKRAKNLKEIINLKIKEKEMVYKTELGEK